MDKQGLNAQVVIINFKDLKISEESRIKMKINSSFRVSLNDNSIGFILVLIRLKKSLANMNLIYLRKYIKCTIKQKI